jgi:hypothetical protein
MGEEGRKDCNQVSREDYAHWHEEQNRIWWEEEGRHSDFDRDVSYEEAELEATQGAAEAFAEDLAENDAHQIIKTICDADYRRRWPKAVPLIEREMRYRGISTIGELNTTLPRGAG